MAIGDILFIDPDGNKAIDRGDIDNKGKHYVEYKGRFYEKISPEDAAKLILSMTGYRGFRKTKTLGPSLLAIVGNYITGCYISELSFSILEELAENGPELTDTIDSDNKEIKVPVKIRNCIIRKADFWRATFSEGVDFGDTTFGEGAAFEGTKFIGVANFGGATFIGIADFGLATFSKVADFGFATFSEKADFHDATFSGEANFGNTMFDGESRFWLATFRGRANFFHSKFNKKVNFGLATFSGEAIFVSEEEIHNFTVSGARFEKTVSLIKNRFKGTTSFEKTIFRETAFFADSSFEQLILKDCSIAQNLELKWEQVKGKIKNHNNKKHEDAADEYRLLKENFRRLGRYEDEDNAYYQMQECKRKAKPHFERNWKFYTCLCLITIFAALFVLSVSASGWFSFCAVPAVFAMLFTLGLAFRRVGERVFIAVAFGHGVRIWNLVGSIIAVLLLFTGLYLSDYGNIASNAPPTPCAFYNSLYFSIITFATVGFGDISAQGWLAGAAMIEGLLGIILNAALVVVIFRKIVR